MLDWIKQHWQQLVAAAVIIVVLTWYHNYQTAKFEQAIQLSTEQSITADALRSELKLSKSNADLLAAEVQRAQANQIQPVTHITVQAATPTQAAADVTERINNNDSTLPAALEESDRTVVTEQPDNSEYQVGIYKINLNKSHKVKAGVSYIDDKPYMSIGYQQNKIEVLAHIRGQRTAGVSILYTVKEW